MCSKRRRPLQESEKVRVSIPGSFVTKEARVDLERHRSPRQAGKIDMTPVDFIVNECVNEEEAW